MTYTSPGVTDYGRLEELTAAAHLLYGAHVADLGFSSPGSSPHASTGTLSSQSASGVSPTAAGTSAVTAHHATHALHHAGATGAVGANAASSGAAGTTRQVSGLHRLPFTGFPAAATAAIGASFLATGTLVRRLLRRSPQAPQG